jgi:dipeptidyl aminopeptidase/acylaminoacyl peptidase
MTVRTFNSVVAATVLLAGGLQAQATGRPLAIEDYYRVKTVGSPQISPDGQWVAFTIATRIEESNNDRSEVWLVDASGGAAPVQVSPPGVDARGASWTELGLLRYTMGGTAYTVNPSNPTSSRTAAAANQQGQRSPDERWVASVRNLPVAKKERSFASEFERRHEERFKGVQFDWFPFQRDGGQFPVANTMDPVVSPPAEVFLNGTDRERQLTSLGLRPTGLDWSPDSKLLVFAADSNYRQEMRYGRPDIWTVTVDGTVRRLTRDDGFENSNPSFSPDGKWIAFIRGFDTNRIIREKLNHGGPTDLYLVAPNGGAPVNLTAQWDLLPGSPMWSPDSKYIYFTAGIGGETHLFRVASAGGAVEQVTSGARRIGGLSIDKAFKRMTYTVGRFEAPSEIYVADIDGRNERQLTRVHDAFTREVALSRAERLRFTSPDGTPVEGWLMFPHNYNPNARYPLIVSSHGGPHSASGYGFNFKHQFFAANGYFVLETNFRSSTGYGEKFLWGTWGEWGTKDGADVMAGVDHAIANYPIDRNRVGTTGHSYGGFMTNWLITQYPDRFAAAIPGAGIVNWVSDYGTADIAVTKETEFLGYPWEERARNIMIKQSPLTYAGRVKAPTLFVHGEVDQRVPYEEAEQMYTALKKIGVPTKMIQYAGMPHGISGHWNNVHRILNEFRWWEQYLKPAKVTSN